MEDNKINNSLVVLADHNFVNPQGIKALMVRNACLVWVWNSKKISVYETTCVGGTKNQDLLDERDKPKKNEVTVKNCVIDIFKRNNESVYVLDEHGVVHLFQFPSSNPVNYMEVEDLFSSPPTSIGISEWKEEIIELPDGCDRVINNCMLSSDIAIVVVKYGNLFALICSLPEFKLKHALSLREYPPQGAVISSCIISFMAKKLKQLFKIESFDEEIVVIGLESGLVLWFCSSTPSKGPHVFFHAYQKIESLHWIKDSNTGHYTHLLVILRSGQIVVFGGEKSSTLYLPDTVKSSCCLKNFIVTSNSVDCYSSCFNTETDISLSCVSLPVKGVCALACAPESDNLLIAATIHGSIYCFDPTVAPSSKTSLFTLPDQSILDNMFLQSQNLEVIYKQLKQEKEILKAVSAAVAANSGTDLFEITINVVSDNVFSVMAKLIESKITFLCALWSICVEVINESGRREVSFYKLKQDFSCSSDLTVSVSHSLSVSDVVSVELVYFLENQQPVLIIPVGKVEIDACYIISPDIVSESTSKSEEILENILDELLSTTPKQTLHQCTLTVKLPNEFAVNSFFKTVLSSCQQRFSPNEWDKLSSERKLNVPVRIGNLPLLLNLDTESRKLNITSSSVKLCHQVKNAIVKRLQTCGMKVIPENIILDVQAIHQTFEIESLKEETSIETLDSLRKNLRASASAELAV